MTAQHLVNSLGLFFDIVGVVIIWKFGLPPEVSRSGHQYLITSQIDEAEKDLATRYERYSRCGLALILLGFVCQLASNWI